MRFLVLASLLVSAAAFADPAPAQPEGKLEVGLHDDCARARAQHKDCIINITGGEEIDGNHPVATDAMLDFLKWTKSQSLIHLRRDFIPEIVKTAEDL
ncbi:MAG: hypothetical protein ABI591_14340 [Kofleriaceae bacterium]